MQGLGKAKGINIKAEEAYTNMHSIIGKLLKYKIKN